MSKQIVTYTPKEYADRLRASLGAALSGNEDEKYAFTPPPEVPEVFEDGLNLLAGRPAMGKSSLALQAAFQAAKNVKDGEYVYYISSVFTYDPFWRLLLMCGVPGAEHYGQVSFFDPERIAAIGSAVRYLQDLPIVFIRVRKETLADALETIPDGASVVFDGFSALYSMYDKPKAYAPAEEALYSALQHMRSMLVTVGVKRTVERRKDRVPRPGDLRIGELFKTADKNVFALYRAGYYSCGSDDSALLRAYSCDGKVVDHPMTFGRCFANKYDSKPSESKEQNEGRKGKNGGLLQNK